MAKRAYVWIPTFWLDDRQIMQLSDEDFCQFFHNYVRDPENIFYEDARYEWDLIREKVRKQVFERDEPVCKSCGSRDMLEVDHIIPISRGGSNQLDNLQILCKTCNIKKGNRL
jgi:CRISPR/Cas system Type II protein with McrA/HNH and RuvC-like nuclease domain